MYGRTIVEILVEFDPELAFYRDTILERFVDIILIVGGDTTVKFANHSIGILGYTPDEVAGRSFLEFVPEESVANVCGIRKIHEVGGSSGGSRSRCSVRAAK